MADITISSRVRTNLLSLQSTSDLMTLTQSRLATGKKVQSALEKVVSGGGKARAQCLPDQRHSDGIGALDQQFVNPVEVHPTLRCARTDAEQISCAMSVQSTRMRAREITVERCG